MSLIKYYLSSGNWGDGKSVCLWRETENTMHKIARFQNDKAARKFASEFGFPLSDNVQKRLYGEESK